jgi:hypothetical protein
MTEPDRRFKALEDELRKKRDGALVIDGNYLAEQDGDTYFSGENNIGRNFRQRAASIEQRLRMTREQIAREIQAQVVARIFDGQTPVDQLGTVGQEVTIFTTISPDSSPTTPMHH